MSNQSPVVAIHDAMTEILANSVRVTAKSDSELFCGSYTLDEGDSYPANLTIDQDQLERDWADLEEDDKFIFYPIQLFGKHGDEYQSFTLYQRTKGGAIVEIPEYLEWEQEEEAEVCPVDALYDDGVARHVFTMYKRVDKKIRPVSTTFSPEYEVQRRIPEDPLNTLPELTLHPPRFQPTPRLDHERLKILEINKDGFLSPEEEKLFIRVMELNQHALAFEDAERGTFKDEYFSPYKIATVPHVPWEYKNIPIPP
ncbi:hypothetical protein K438DRAFT_2121237, partial [Mycena galopus ATCC 62051]